MAVPQLTLVPRETIQDKSVKAARKEGNIPAVVYSKGKPTKEVFADEKEIMRLLNEFGSNRKITLNLNGEKSFAIIKEVQKDYMKNRFIHLDLQALDENVKLSMMMNINILNRDSVEKGDYVLQVQANEVEIEMFPRHMPDSVEVDAALLRDKDNLTMADLNIATDENIEILDDKETVIATLSYIQEISEEESEEVVDAGAVPTVGETEGTAGEE
ncbi:50S ribosomal protein L25 [Tindallia californiensis]|uniref:Large subunit ribosomal protein L25 n=1 Tax=Tindallia californiensis TaxID=159292 RepID=A0A1H3MBG8_9FIRM|nr:50S ribosomal protein L25 [Tindallia californiensis]SDY73638.1 large subunit ribosomal protein L25 [Tindallia californiensis]